MTLNLDGRTFRSVSNTDNGEVSSRTIFHYRHLIARMLDDGRLDMRYHHLNDKGELMLGTCLSTPERLADGRLRFKEEWRWLSGDLSSGYSEIEEVAE